MRTLATLEFCPVTKEQMIGDDRFDFAVFGGGRFVGYAFEVLDRKSVV